MPTIACSICWATLGDAQCRQLVASTWRNARWHRGYKVTSKTGTTVYLWGMMFASCILRERWGRYLVIPWNQLKSTYTDSNLQMCFVNALCPANVRQLRPYLLLTASSGKPTLCLCSHKQNMANSHCKGKKFRACTALPFKDKEGAISSPGDANVVVQKCDILGFTLAEHYIVLAGISDRNPTRQTCPLWLMCCCYCTGVAELCEPFSWQSVREGAHFGHAQLTIL